MWNVMLGLGVGVGGLGFGVDLDEHASAKQYSSLKHVRVRVSLGEI